MSAKQALAKHNAKYQKVTTIRQYAADLEDELKTDVKYSLEFALRCGDQWQAYIKECATSDKSDWFCFLMHGTKEELIEEYRDEWNDPAGMGGESMAYIGHYLKERFGYDVYKELRGK